MVIEGKTEKFINLKKKIRTLCHQYKIKPLRRRGQNFLINQRILTKVLEAAELKRSDLVLEIGPGFGGLTREIAKRVKKVLAVEIDKKFVEILEEKFKDYKNIEIVQGNILDANLKPINQLINQPFNYKIVANLPYNITGAVLRKFLSEKSRPKLMVLVLQKETVKRICALPPQMSLLSNLVQYYGQPKIISRVSRESSWPRPRVESAIVKIVIKENLPQINEGHFFSLLRAGFQQPRKYLLNNLIHPVRNLSNGARSAIIGSEGEVKTRFHFDRANQFQAPLIIKKNKDELKEILESLGKDPKVRPGELSVEDWLKLFNNLNL